jgi:hypothetical protein
MEEMSHFGLACNILNAIGGSPTIDNPDFVPSYPGPLPCGVEGQLTVPLAPFSLDLVSDVFMVIEEPEDPVVTAAEDFPTIGQFYDAISAALAEQPSSIFVAKSVQVTNQSPFVTPVTDLASAQAAIERIVEQGEGTTTSPDDAQGDLAHYYRFGEIYHGMHLIQNPSPPPAWVYEGQPAISFDTTGVLPLVTNPKGSQYPDGSAAQKANDTFNQTYATLLKDLETAFTSTADLSDAIGDMGDLATQAAAVMAIELGDGTNAGPSFEYVSSG